MMMKIFNNKKNFGYTKVFFYLIIYYDTKTERIHFTIVPANQITSNQIHHWINIVFPFVTLSSSPQAVKIKNPPHNAYNTATRYKKVIKKLT